MVSEMIEAIVYTVLIILFSGTIGYILNIYVGNRGKIQQIEEDISSLIDNRNTTVEQYHSLHRDIEAIHTYLKVKETPKKIIQSKLIKK